MRIRGLALLVLLGVVWAAQLRPRIGAATLERGVAGKLTEAGALLRPVPQRLAVDMSWSSSAASRAWS